MTEFQTLTPHTDPLVRDLFEQIRQARNRATDQLFIDDAILSLIEFQKAASPRLRAFEAYAELTRLTQLHIQGEPGHAPAALRLIESLRAELSAPAEQREAMMGLGRFVRVLSLICHEPDVQGALNRCFEAGLTEGYVKFKNEHGVQVNVRISRDPNRCFFAYGPLTAKKLERLERTG